MGRVAVIFSWFKIYRVCERERERESVREKERDAVSSKTGVPGEFARQQ